MTSRLGGHAAWRLLLVSSQCCGAAGDVQIDVVAIYAEAARTDPDIAHDLQTIMANRERAFRRHIEAIAGHLAPGVSVSDALGIYLTLVLPEVYCTLVLERGWTADR